MTTPAKLTRRDLLKGCVAAGIVAPWVRRGYAAAPSETLLHASFGASGMAFADLQELTRSKNLKLVAVAEVDLSRVG